MITFRDQLDIDDTLTFTSTMDVDLERLDDFLAELKPIFASLADQPGCLFAYLTQAVRSPGTIMLFERWIDRETFRVFTQTEPWQRYMALTEPWYSSQRVVTGWQVLAVKTEPPTS